jgi:hypothetical protein
MTVQQISDLKTPIGDVLRAAGAEGVLLESAQQCYAVIPLDDDLIDYLIERNPRFVEECRKLRQKMEAGQFKTHEEVKRLLAGEN